MARWVGIQKDGWSGSKASFLPTDPDGTMVGPKAIRQGIALLKRVREAVGPDFDIHIDVPRGENPHHIIEACQIERTQFDFTWWLTRLFNRNGINEQRIISLVQDMRREFHFDAVIRGENAFLERNRFKQCVVR